MTSEVRSGSSAEPRESPVLSRGVQDGPKWAWRWTLRYVKYSSGSLPGGLPSVHRENQLALGKGPELELLTRESPPPTEDKSLLKGIPALLHWTEFFVFGEPQISEQCFCVPKPSS